MHIYSFAYLIFRHYTFNYIQLLQCFYKLWYISRTFGNICRFFLYFIIVFQILKCYNQARKYIRSDQISALYFYIKVLFFYIILNVDSFLSIFINIHQLFTVLCIFIPLEVFLFEKADFGNKEL